jgi:hypothetical protein
MERKGIFLPPGGGRSYPMGRISSRFWPTAQRPTRSIRSRNGGSRRTRSGPGAHSHDEDDVFYVLEGTMSILLGDRWVDARVGRRPGAGRGDARFREPRRDAGGRPQRLRPRRLRVGDARNRAVVRRASARERDVARPVIASRTRRWRGSFREVCETVRRLTHVPLMWRPGRCDAAW